MLVLFDLDGTLIDSRRDLAGATNALIEERGGRPLPVETITAMVGEGAGVLVRRALTASGLDAQDSTALGRFLELYDERLLDHTTLYDGVEEALETLRSTGPLAVLTNKPGAAARRLLEALGIAPAFRWVLGGDGPHPRKPDPGGVRFICAAAGVAPRDAILVGDSAIDLATARAAGCRICLVRYGFGFRGGEMPLTGDESIADTPRDIPRLVAAAAP